MLALIMAGGEGSRLRLGEKPLVTVAGQPMISHVIRAFSAYGCTVVVVASRKTPMTKNWCRVSAIDCISAKGEGYIEDMVSAVTELGDLAPLFVSVCDIPCLHAGILARIEIPYRKSKKDACSTWVPVQLIKNRREVQFIDRVNNTDACPCGINILRGDLIQETQEELRLLLNEPRLAHNVNTRTELAEADSFLRANLRQD